MLTVNSGSHKDKNVDIIDNVIVPLTPVQYPHNTPTWGMWAM